MSNPDIEVLPNGLVIPLHVQGLFDRGRRSAAMARDLLTGESAGLVVRHRMVEGSKSGKKATPSGFYEWWLYLVPNNGVQGIVGFEEATYSGSDIRCGIKYSGILIPGSGFRNEQVLGAYVQVVKDRPTLVHSIGREMEHPFSLESQAWLYRSENIGNNAKGNLEFIYSAEGRRRVLVYSGSFVPEVKSLS